MGTALSGPGFTSIRNIAKHSAKPTIVVTVKTSFMSAPRISAWRRSAGSTIFQQLIGVLAREQRNDDRAIEAALLGQPSFTQGEPVALTRDQATEKATALAKAEMEKLDNPE